MARFQREARAVAGLTNPHIVTIFSVEEADGNLRGLCGTNLVLAVTYGQLGEPEKARIAVRELLVQMPGFTTGARDELSKWWQPEYVDQLLDGLREAGLE